MNIAHRYPLLLIDRVIEEKPGELVRAIKNVSFNEKVFLGHFPDQPIYPGIYQVEGLCQCAQVLLGAKVAVTAKLDKFKFLKKVVPGDQLIYEVKLESLVGGFQTVTAKAYLGEEVVTKGQIIGRELEA